MRSLELTARRFSSARCLGEPSPTLEAPKAFCMSEIRRLLGLGEAMCIADPTLGNSDVKTWVFSLASWVVKRYFRASIAETESAN